MRNLRWTAISFFSLYVVIALFGCRKEFLYTTIGMRIQNYDNSGSYIQPAGVTVPSNAYVLRINYSSDLADYIAVDDNNNYVNSNAPTAIAVTVLENYDTLHPANSSMMDCFINGPGTTSPQSVVDNFQDKDSHYPNHLPDDLWLMVPPDTAGTYSFIIQMNFNDGAVFRDTAVVNLN